MAARTRCSPAVSRNPFLNESRPKSSCTCARLDHAAHQSSQRSSEPVSSSKSASSTPFETKRGAQWEIADATFASWDTGRSRLVQVAKLPQHERQRVGELRATLRSRAPDPVPRLIVEPQ